MALKIPSKVCAFLSAVFPMWPNAFLFNRHGRTATELTLDAGSLSPTGPGVFLFETQQAATLFNQLAV